VEHTYLRGVKVS